jgi:hypothetical protein
VLSTTDKKEVLACATKKSLSSILVTDEMSEWSVRAVLSLDPLLGKMGDDGVGDSVKIEWGVEGVEGRVRVEWGL